MIAQDCLEFTFGHWVLELVDVKSLSCVCLLLSTSQLDLHNNQVVVTTDVCSTVHSDVLQTWSHPAWSNCKMVDLCKCLVVI